MSTNQVSRRTFLQTAAIAGTTTITGSSALAAPLSAATKGSAKATIVAPDNANIVETISGKVRGSQRNGIHIFRGIPYGADTGGKNRFLPAMKPEPWSGVRSALWYEHVCPAGPRGDWKNDENAFLFQWNDGQSGEDCLRANVWTPGINDNKKRAVMVWIHGGGWTSGSGQELLAYDGENLCRRGDVVVVSFNHRLNAFGFLNLSDFGPEYATSGNVGFTDLIFVLQWVRDNIANFGGDPANVTIMGQSGGGSKVNALLATPSAKGLFHKASIHSGSSLRVLDAETSMRTAAAVLSELGITKANPDKLHTITTQQLLEAGLAATRRGGPRAAPAPGAPRPTARFGYGAYLDGNIIPNQHQTWDPAAPDISADIPILVGTVLNEMVTAMDKPDAFSLTIDQLKTQLAPNFGSHTAEVIEAFQKGHPKANPFQLSSIITASGGARANAVTQSQRKAALGKAPSYNFWFTWQPPILEGRPMAFHCADLSFFFDNMERCETMTGNGPDARKLSTQMSEAWIAFAKTGNPNHSGIPKWNPVTPTGSETMIFDSPSTFSAESDSAERKVLESARQPPRT